MKKALLFIALYLCAALSLFGQVSAEQQVPGFNLQALARDARGRLLPLQTLEMRVSFVQRDGSLENILYAEIHQVVTDDLGLFDLSIGNGKPLQETFSDADWSSGQVWMDLEIRSAGTGNFRLVQSTQLNAVPYAFHARTANRLLDEGKAREVEKNQSIFWITSGNTGTIPETHFIGTRDSQDLVFKTKNISRGKITSNGQFVIEVDPKAIETGTITLSDKEKTSYPLTIEGSSNGIYIKVDGSRDGSNKFLCFRDEISDWGGVVGQTLDELKDTWDYKLRIADFASVEAGYATSIAASVASALTNAAAATCVAATLALAWQAPGYTTQAEGDGLSALASGLGAATTVKEILNWTKINARDIGVSYSSGAADYAEWLERIEGERDHQIGELVGVHSGKVSLKTEGAQRVMVVSTAPAFLGNKPNPGDEHRFEKIAFVGQVNVRVAGPVRSGDYILPSGNHDGLGIAVHPEDMDYDDYPKVAGIAWESAADQPVNIVRVGVGLNRNDLGPKVTEISGKVDNILAYLEGKAPLQRELSPSARQISKAPELKKLMTDEAFDALLVQYANALKQHFTQIEQQIKAGGGEITDPVLAEMIRDPVAAGKIMRRDPRLESIWAHFDQLITVKQ
jgi:hypothetical protein